MLRADVSGAAAPRGFIPMGKEKLDGKSACLKASAGIPAGQAGVVTRTGWGGHQCLSGAAESFVSVSVSLPSHQILMEQHLSPSTTPLLLSPFLVWAALAWQSLPAPLLLQNLEEKHKLTQE